MLLRNSVLLRCPRPALFRARSQPWQRVQADLFQRSAGRFPALDGIRALAALMIVYFHATGVVDFVSGRSILAIRGFVRSLLGALWFGVDIFFVLSGFLIGHILLLQMQRGGVAFRSFYFRRAFRIFPAYYVVLTLNVLIFIHLSVFSPLHFNIPWAAWLKFSIPSYLYLGNYSRTTEVMGWAWSLCVEEHFYLIFPTILVVLFRLSPRVRLVALLTLPLLPLAARTIALIGNPGGGTLPAPVRRIAHALRRPLSRCASRVPVCLPSRSIGAFRDEARPSPPRRCVRVLRERPVDGRING